MKLTKEPYAIGTHLLLASDSAFLYRSCGGRSYGKWHVVNDSLILEADSTRHEYGNILYVERSRQSFRIAGSQLRSRVLTQDGSYIRHDFQRKNE